MSTLLIHKRPHTPLSISYLGTPNGQYRRRSRSGWSGFGWTTFRWFNEFHYRKLRMWFVRAYYSRTTSKVLPTPLDSIHYSSLPALDPQLERSMSNAAALRQTWRKKVYLVTWLPLYPALHWSQERPGKYLEQGREGGKEGRREGREGKEGGKGREGGREGREGERELKGEFHWSQERPGKYLEHFASRNNVMTKEVIT